MRNSPVYTTVLAILEALLNLMRTGVVGFFVTCLLVSAGTFPQEVARTFTTRDGLPSDDVVSVAVIDGQIFAQTAAGVARFYQGRWWPGAANFPKAQAPDVRVYASSKGLPYDEITSAVAGEHGVVWLATPK